MTPVSALALEVIYPAAKLERVGQFVRPLNATMERFDIVTPERQAAFLATIGWESVQLSRVVENLHYTTAAAVVRSWPTRFTLETAKAYLGKPVDLANLVYAGRFGNGDVASGDGWRYRGRGLTQITFKANYQACSLALFKDAQVLLRDPALLEIPEHAAASAGWYWFSKKCNELADDGKFREITRVVQGGYGGYNERVELWNTAKSVLV